MARPRATRVVTRLVIRFGAALACAGLVPCASSARVFDFKDESVATYLKGAYGPSAVGSSPYAASSGASTASFDQVVRGNYSGEFGALFASSRFNLRLGVEFLIPSRISDVKGKDAGGAELFNLDTRTTALIPTLHLELVTHRAATSKAFVGAGVGYGYVKMENSYRFTAAGSAAYPALGDFTEKAQGRAIASHVYAGYETLLADHAAVVFDLGYRHLRAADLAHLTAADTFNGAVSRGEPVRKSDGAARGIDLSGGYAGLALRFYIGL